MKRFIYFIIIILFCCCASKKNCISESVKTKIVTDTTFNIKNNEVETTIEWILDDDSIFKQTYNKQSDNTNKPPTDIKSKAPYIPKKGKIKVTQKLKQTEAKGKKSVSTTDKKKNRKNGQSEVLKSNRQDYVLIFLFAIIIVFGVKYWFRAKNNSGNTCKLPK